MEVNLGMVVDIELHLNKRDIDGEIWRKQLRTVRKKGIIVGTGFASK